MSRKKSGRIWAGLDTGRHLGDREGACSHVNRHRLQTHLNRMSSDEDYARQYGKKCEKRFFDAWRTSNMIPGWLSGVRKASLLEDTTGIDVIFMTEYGPIPLQIKCTGRGKKRFEEDDTVGIPCFIMKFEMTPKDVRFETLNILSEQIRQKGRLKKFRQLMQELEELDGRKPLSREGVLWDRRMVEAETVMSQGLPVHQIPVPVAVAA